MTLSVTLALVPLSAVDRLFAHAERATALLDRCRPTNGAAEIERVASLWERGEPASPAFRYLPRPELAPLLGALEAVVDIDEGACPWAALYAARAHELHREALIVDALETPAFAARAAARFPVDDTEDGRDAAKDAETWSRLVPAADVAVIASDDPKNPRSLLSLLQALVGELRLPVRVTTSSELASAAATGDGFIVVRSALFHPEARARRIALHEVYGHALPRERSREEGLGLFGVGTAGSADDEEGRALLIEERHGLIDDARRQELALRHVAATATRSGANFVETVRQLLERGVKPRHAVVVTARVQRGGGLARELVYLPAFHRVRRAFEREPSLERWFERGRISLAAARALRGMGEVPVHFAPPNQAFAEA